MNPLKEWCLQETKDCENNTVHRLPNEEIPFFRAISNGDIDAIKKGCAQKPFTDLDGLGKLSKDPVTNLKYHFVVSTALVTRLCAQNGMEQEQAFRLSDFYIQKLDSIHTTQAVADLRDRMVLDFGNRMRLLQKNAPTSKAVTKCIDYIYLHIKERITIEDLAAYTGLSTSYLSRLFKQETGISVSDYIREKKVEKAQNLLKYCDYSLIEIANYLSFSSQSHFIQIFKKVVGITPKKYRDLHYHTTWDIAYEQKT